jgi:hypothetical protein
MLHDYDVWMPCPIHYSGQMSPEECSAREDERRSAILAYNENPGLREQDAMKDAARQWDVLHPATSPHWVDLGLCWVYWDPSGRPPTAPPPGWDHDPFAD